MVNIVSPYSVGDQPCPNFRARAEERPCNRRGCQRTLHGCLSCMKDHHQLGWQTCKEPASKPR